MGLIPDSAYRRPKNIMQQEPKCMNCSKSFTPGRGVYERRFCSQACVDEYFS